MLRLLLFLFIVAIAHAELHATYDEQRARTREEQTRACTPPDILNLLTSTIDSMTEAGMGIRTGETREPNRLAVFGKQLQNELTLGSPFCLAYARAVFTLANRWSVKYMPVPEEEMRTHCERTLALSLDPYVKTIGEPGRLITSAHDGLRNCLETGMFAAIIPDRDV